MIMSGIPKNSEGAGGLFAATTRNRVEVSFEFFPPTSDELAEKHWQALMRLAPLGPKFVSVTYGAGGSTRGAHPCARQPNPSRDDTGARRASDVRRRVERRD